MGMFLPTLEKQLDKLQRQKWLDKAQRYQIIGTYAQTELGHGNSNKAKNHITVLLYLITALVMSIQSKKIFFCTQKSVTF